MVLTVKNPPAIAEDIRDAGLIPRLGRAPAGKHSNSLRYSCLENSMDRGAWWALVHRVAKSQTQAHAQHIVTASVNEIINIFFQLIFVGMWEPFHVCIVTVSKNFARNCFIRSKSWIVDSLSISMIRQAYVFNLWKCCLLLKYVSVFMRACFSLLYLSKNRYLYVIYDYTQIHTYISWKVKVYLYIIFFPLKSLLNMFQYCFCLMFWFFDWESGGMLASWARQGSNHHPLPCKTKSQPLDYQRSPCIPFF